MIPLLRLQSKLLMAPFGVGALLVSIPFAMAMLLRPSPDHAPPSPPLGIQQTMARNAGRSMTPSTAVQEAELTIKWPPPENGSSTPPQQSELPRVRVRIGPNGCVPGQLYEGPETGRLFHLGRDCHWYPGQHSPAGGY